MKGNHHIGVNFTLLLTTLMISIISGLASADDNSDTVPPIPIFDLVEFRYENSTPLVIDGSSSYDPNGNGGFYSFWVAAMA